MDSLSPPPELHNEEIHLPVHSDTHRTSSTWLSSIFIFYMKMHDMYCYEVSEKTWFVYKYADTRVREKSSCVLMLINKRQNWPFFLPPFHVKGGCTCCACWHSLWCGVSGEEQEQDLEDLFFCFIVFQVDCAVCQPVFPGPPSRVSTSDPCTCLTGKVFYWQLWN